MRFSKLDCSEQGYALLRWEDGPAGRASSQHSHRMSEAAVDRILAMQAAADAAKPRLLDLFAAPEESHAPSLTFRIPRPPSSKNMRKLGRRGAHACMYRAPEVVEATALIQEAAVRALFKASPNNYRRRESFIPDADVQVLMVHHVVSDCVDVMVRNLAPKPLNKTGRKSDVVNLPEVVLDAMQGIAYTNDNQVSDLRVWRSYQREPLHD
jgi:hypothetical protein